MCCIDFCFEKRQFLAVLSYKSSFLSDIDADMQKRGTTPIDFKRKQSCSLDLLALNDMTSPGGKCTNFSYIHKIQWAISTEKKKFSLFEKIHTSKNCPFWPR